MEIYNHCPSCGYNKVRATNNQQVAVRKCEDCKKFHCNECPETKKMTSYRCPYCNSTKISPYGVIR